MSALLLGAAVPFSALAQCPDGTPPPCRTPAARAPAPAANSIAVLPFANRSPDIADVYLAEGMTDEVGNHLTRLSRLQVKAHGVVAAAWQRNPDPLGAARALRVAWYVHGYVRHVAPQLLVSVELVRPATGAQVWAKRFARPDADVFAAQAEVAESVAVVVGGRLSPGERAVLARRPTRNNGAYRLYLLGRSLLARRTPGEVRDAVEAFTQAVRLDSGFAGAWAQLGYARVVQFSSAATYGWVADLPQDSLLALAFVASRRALELDSLSAEAWAALGMAYDWERRDMGAAGAALTRAVMLDSLNPVILYSLASFYSDLSLDSVPLPYYRRALALDPGARGVWRRYAMASLGAGQLAESEARYDTALVFGPWDMAYLDRSQARFARGNGRGALADLAEAERLNSTFRARELRELFTISLGDSAPARAVLERLRAEADSGRPNFRGLARFSMALGLRDAALEALEELRRVPSRALLCAPSVPCSAHLATWNALHDPLFAPLRGDPRFERLWQETRPRLPWLEGYR